MITLPDPVLWEYGDWIVVRDDLLPGGTKRRALAGMIEPGREYVYASPVYGYAQIAIAITCAEVGANATIFCAKRNTPHARTLEAIRAGAEIIEVPCGYLSVCRALASEYAARRASSLLPFGLDTPEFIERIAEAARSLPYNPDEVWSVAGSGTLTRGLQMAWPAAKVYAVRVGADPSAGAATILTEPEKFEADAKDRPPFPSCSNYDAKAWQFIKRLAKPGALFWNVAA